MPDTVTIPVRFRGPPESANGGYACGLFAGLLEGDVETTLRAPPPLERPLTVSVEGDGVVVADGDTRVAEVRPAVIEFEVPVPPTLEDARAAVSGWPSAEEHFFPTCFTCGPARDEGDGMRIFPGSTSDEKFNAAPWIPPVSVADADGLVREAVMWAAMDCPGMAAGMSAHDREVGERRVAMLGRMAARVDRRAKAEETYAVFGWPLGRDGRKLYSASAVVDGAGSVLSVARLTSIALE